MLHICRAVALGLTADDLAKVDSFIEDLKEQKEKDDTTEHIKKIAEADVLKIQVGIKCRFLILLYYQEAGRFSGTKHLLN